MKKLFLTTLYLTMLITNISHGMFKQDRKRVELSHDTMRIATTDLIELETLYLYQNLETSLNAAYIHQHPASGKYLLRHIYTPNFRSDAIKNSEYEFNSQKNAQAALLKFLQDPERAPYQRAQEPIRPRPKAPTHRSTATSPQVSPQERRQAISPAQGHLSLDKALSRLEKEAEFTLLA